MNNNFFIPPLVNFTLNGRRNKGISPNSRSGNCIKWFNSRYLDFGCGWSLKIFGYCRHIFNITNDIHPDSSDETDREVRKENEEGIDMAKRKTRKSSTKKTPRKKKDSSVWGDYLLYAMIAFLIYLFLKSRGIIFD